MMPEPSSESARELPAMDWSAYLVFTLITLAASMVGGCINRQEARQKHEQILGKVEEIRQEVIARRDNR